MLSILKADAGRIRFQLSLLAGVAFLISCDSSSVTDASRRTGPGLQGPELAVASGEYVKFYVHAHEDDWQLFMGAEASAGLATVPNIVFIYTSAGDFNRGVSYMQYRERASQQSMDTLLGPGSWTCGTQVVRNHPIERCSRGRAVAYYMRTPDGGQNGDGYGGRGSLAMLRDGAQSSITALDGSTTYTSWADFTSTLGAIIDLESANQSSPFVEVHAPEYDRTTNINDHPDHLATADAMHTASNSRSWNMVWHIDYQTQFMPINLNQAQHDIEQRLFYAYDNYMGAGGFGRNQYEPNYQAWLWRSYSRSTVSVPPTPPTAPTGLQASAASASRVNLTWTDNATNESAYLIERAPDAAGVAGAYTQVASIAVNSASYADTTLASNTRYWFRVRASNTGGNSGYSNAVAIQTLLRPAAPTALQGQSPSTTRIDLTWVDNATNETAYVVERAPDNAGIAGTFASIASIPANSTSYSNTGLGANTRYWYRVRAVDATDTSLSSAQIVVATQPGPPAPTNLVAQAASATTINLAWTDNATVETGYTVERAPDNAGVAGAFAAIATLPANSVNYSDATAVPNTRYWYRVRDFTSTDVSAYSALVSATTPDVPPAAPSALQAFGATYSRIDLQWVDNSSNESGFLIERASDNGGTPGTFAQIASVAANATTYSDAALPSSTSYWYRVRATNAVQPSAYAGPVSATTLLAPTSLTHVYVHAHQDDWETFMGEFAYTSVQAASKVVFVYTTAGDGGQAAAFWQTRELAAQAAVDAIFGAGGWTCASQTVLSHAIRRCVKGTSVSYDMRLPDGGTGGEGFGGRGSLGMLRDGAISSLSAIDGSTTYTSWSDFAATLGAIVDLESGSLGGPFVVVHAPEYNRTTNPNDHPDHFATADAVQLASNTHTWSLSWHVDYQTQNLAINLSQAAHDQKVLSFYGYDNYMGVAGYGRNQYETNYQDWLWRDYFRSTGP